MYVPHNHTQDHRSATHSHTPTHSHSQALDESHSVSNEGISVYNKLEEDPVLEMM